MPCYSYSGGYPVPKIDGSGCKGVFSRALKYILWGYPVPQSNQVGYPLSTRVPQSIHFSTRRKHLDGLRLVLRRLYNSNTNTTSMEPASYIHTAAGGICTQKAMLHGTTCRVMGERNVFHRGFPRRQSLFRQLFYVSYILLRVLLWPTYRTTLKTANPLGSNIQADSLDNEGESANAEDYVYGKQSRRSLSKKPLFSLSVGPPRLEENRPGNASQGV